MGGSGRRLTGLLFAAAVTAGIAGLSRAPYVPAASTGSLLRLSWGIRGERVEECRRVSAEELAAQPIHMRRAEVCEGRVAPYHLRVEVDGLPVVSDTVRAAGARGDRLIYVFQELPLEPGKHRIHVQFIRAARGSAAGAPRHDEMDERQASPPTHRLELDRSLEARAGEVVLVTYDPDGRVLVARRPDRRPAQHPDTP